MWRVVTHERRIATLHEAQTFLSVEDLARAHLALDVFDELDRRKAEKLRHEMPRGRRR